MKDKKVYLVEWGYFLAKDSVEYEKYSNVYDKKNAYYDEMQYYSTLDLETLINNLTYTMKHSTRRNAYLIISYQCMLSSFNVESIGSDEELNNYYFDTWDLDYSAENVVFSIWKDENGTMYINFIEKE